MAHRFVSLPTDASGRRRKTYLYKADRRKKVREVLWGDWLNVEAEEADGWLKVVWNKAGAEPEELFIPKEHTATTRPLEIVFLDVGQGDGAVLITPERGSQERVIVIDAGVSGNMHAFLSKRFGGYNETFRFHAAVLTHPDLDHYKGFETIFAAPMFHFDVIYHSGLIERPDGKEFEKFGGLVEDPADGRDYVTGLPDGRDDIAPFFLPPADVGDSEYGQVMRAALQNPGVKDFALLSTATAKQEAGRSWMPGFAPSDGRDYAIEVLGPRPEPDAAGGLRLRRLGDYNETKNGHSVVLRLHYRGFRVLFGGDLNDKAEKYLLSSHAGLSAFPRKGTAAYDGMIAKAAESFRADVMKVCHHGSEKVTDAFLEAVRPAAFVISSGDKEGHVHPRPDLLGRLGKAGFGDAPVLLSTELQRSTREFGDAELAMDLQREISSLDGKPTLEQVKALTDGIADLAGSNVTVYGTIYLKTDGTNLLTAFRIETGSDIKKWFAYQYRVKASDGAAPTELELVS